MIRQSYKITALYCRIDHGTHSAMSALCAQNQQKRLMFYAREHGLQNPKVFSDCGYPETIQAARRTGNCLPRSVRTRLAILWFYELSRLNRDFENQRRLLLELKAHNVTLHSIQEQIVGLDEPVFRAL